MIKLTLATAVIGALFSVQSFATVVEPCSVEDNDMCLVALAGDYVGPDCTVKITAESSDFIEQYGIQGRHLTITAKQGDFEHSVRKASWEGDQIFDLRETLNSGGTEGRLTQTIYPEGHDFHQISILSSPGKNITADMSFSVDGDLIGIEMADEAKKGEEISCQNLQRVAD